MIQEVYLDDDAGLAEYAERAEMSFFVWLRWLTGMKLNAICTVGTWASRLGMPAARCRSTGSQPPQASSAALAARLVGRLTGAWEAAIREERKARLRMALDITRAG